LRTDSRFTQATPDIAGIRQLSQQLLLPELSASISDTSEALGQNAQSKRVVVTHGFVGADEQGRPTTLGRGGSDFTSALLAEALVGEDL